jgi:hypothetical protein
VVQAAATSLIFCDGNLEKEAFVRHQTPTARCGGGGKRDSGGGKQQHSSGSSTATTASGSIVFIRPPPINRLS